MKLVQWINRARFARQHVMPAALLLLASAALLAMQPAHATQVVQKSAGPTTPYLPDFQAVYANRAGEVGYGNQVPHKLFLETLPVRCGPHQRGVGSATFFITLKKITSTVAGAKQTQLAFWDNGKAHFNTQVWSLNDPAGATKVFSFNLGSLPPVGGMVHMNDGFALNLLRDRDFSFSVTHDASVLNAKLQYQCRTHSQSSGYVDPNNVYSPSTPMPIPAPSSMPPALVAGAQQGPVDQFGRITYSTNFGTPSDTPCPHLNSAYGRAMINSQLIMRRVAPNADTVCARRGAPNGFAQIVFTSCAIDARGPAYGLMTRATVTCNR